MTVPEELSHLSALSTANLLLAGGADWVLTL